MEAYDATAEERRALKPLSFRKTRRNKSLIMQLPGPLSRAAMVLMLIGVGVPDIAPAQNPSDGLYIRTGLTLDWFGATRFQDTDCSSVSPAALYGCGTGVDGAPISSVGDFPMAGGLELGLGYALESSVRLEGMMRYRPNFTFQGRANFSQTTAEQSVTAELSELSSMLAVYRDFPEVGRGRFKPFAGAGFGISRIAIGKMRMTFPRTNTVVPGGKRNNATWMLTAGMATSVTESWLIDLAWTYSDLGAIETGQGVGHVIWRDRAREPLALDLASTTAGLSRHGLALSLRYSF